MVLDLTTLRQRYIQQSSPLRCKSYTLYNPAPLYTGTTKTGLLKCFLKKDDNHSLSLLKLQKIQYVSQQLVF